MQYNESNLYSYTFMVLLNGGSGLATNFAAHQGISKPLMMLLNDIAKKTLKDKLTYADIAKKTLRETCEKTSQIFDRLQEFDPC